MKHLIVHCRSQQEMGELLVFLEEHQGCKWIRHYRRSGDYYQNNGMKAVIGVPDDQAEFRLSLRFNVLKRCKV